MMLKCFWTVRTFVWIVIEMNFAMNFHSPFSFELLTAKIAQNISFALFNEIAKDGRFK